MAREKKGKHRPVEEAVVVETVLQPINETIEKNYMPYVMSVIVSRAIPEIDGFKPSHRKLLYTMYKMGLLTGQRTKSANVVGQTMKLNPHGDMSIYETLVRLTRGNESLLHPFIDSKGSFGKQYSSEMAFAAPRYTEVKLDSFCAEIFRGIDKNAVELIDNYDSTLKEPLLLPTSFPNILVSANFGIAVGMASKICSFNLAEVCNGTIAYLKNPDISVEEILDIIIAPDFPGGGLLIYDRAKLAEIYTTGVGSLTLRARYVYDKNANCIDIVEIPYSTTIEPILKKITAMIKSGTLKDVTDVRDEIDLHGFKLTLDLRKGVDPDKLMARLFKQTELQSNFACNFNVLIDGDARQLGLREIIEQWRIFRTGCLTRELNFDLKKKCDKLHLLLGLGEILLDIDKAIKIVRETKRDADVIPNLMAGFGIDELQAEYIAEIKLRNLNREYILQRMDEIKSLKSEISDIKATLASEKKMKAYIISQLEQIRDKYAKPRKTILLHQSDIKVFSEEVFIDNYNVRLILTKEGYFKKITLQSLRGNDEQNLKQGDTVFLTEDAENKDEVLFVTDAQKIFRAKLCDIDAVKASSLGSYLPVDLKMDKDVNEKPVMMKVVEKDDSKHHIVFIFENGKGVRIPLSAYQTKTARKKLTGAYSDSSKLVAAFYEKEPFDLIILANDGKAISISSKLIAEKVTRVSVGVQLITLKKNTRVVEAVRASDGKYANPGKYKKIKLPASGTLLDEYNVRCNQLKLDI